MSFLKKAGAVAGLTALLIAADSTCGGATCAEAYDRQVHSPPNGSPVEAAVSRYADHFGDMSPYAQAATFTPLFGLVIGAGLYLKKKSEEGKEKKEEK